MRACTAAAPIACFVALLGMANPAHAQPDQERAFELFTLARGYFERSEYVQALALLEEAYKLHPKPVILLAVAESLEILGQIERSYETYLQVRPGDENQRAKLSASLRRVQEILSKPVKVSVLSDVADAQILVDGVDTGRRAPTVIEVVRGRRSIAVRKEGYWPFQVDGFDASGVDVRVLQAKLRPLTGRLRVEVTPGSLLQTTIKLDGEAIEVADRSLAWTQSMEVRVGDHQVACARFGEASTFATVRVATDQEAVVRCSFLVVEEVHDDYAATLAGVTLLGVGVGGVAYGTALLQGHADEKFVVDAAKKFGVELPLQSSKLEGGIAALVVGGATLLTGVILVMVDRLTAPDPDTPPTASWVPILAPTPGGALVGGHARF
jgi:hypothetical protein